MAGLLDSAPEEIVGKMLLDLGKGTDPQSNQPWPLSVTQELASPDDVIAVYGTQGTITQSIQLTGEQEGMHGIMIRVRSAVYEDGWRRANDIAITLDQSVYKRDVTLDGHVFLVRQVFRTSDVLPLGKESPSSKRQLFTINALVSLRQAS